MAKWYNYNLKIIFCNCEAMLGAPGEGRE